MSVYKSGYISSIGLPWKTFVKESQDNPKEYEEKQTYQLHFQGNNAKVAYEEIINETTETNCSINKSKQLKTAVNVRNSFDKRGYIEGTQCKNNQRLEKANDVPKVTANSILKAVEHKDIRFLQNHVTKENVNITDEFGWTPLMSAAYCGHLEIVEYLLGIGANTKIRERSGLTAAQLASKRNYLNIIALLKRKTNFGSNKNRKDTTTSNANTSSSLCTASSRGQSPKRTKEIINHHADNPKDMHVDTKFYCNICQATFKETTIKKHESSTLHIFNTKPKLPNPVYGISKHNKGYQILLNTGWDEEAGLGPSGRGIKYPIKTLLKMDRKGFGQPVDGEPRVTHYKAGDISAIRTPKQKPLRRRDREKLLKRDARKERALRIALS